MDLQATAPDPVKMPRTMGAAFRKLYIGEWLARLNLKPEHIAKEVGIQPSYLSDMISGKKKNPSARLLLAISEAMGVPMNDLYRAPPSTSQLEAIKDFSPDLLRRLSDAKEQRR